MAEEESDIQISPNEASSSSSSSSSSPIKKLLEPARITTLRGDTLSSKGIPVYIITDLLRLPKQPTYIKNIYAFTTLEELKQEIWYSGLDADPSFIPQNLSLLSVRESFNADEPDAEYPQKGQDYYGTDYLYYDTNASLRDPLILLSPLDVIQGNADERFVNTDGQLQPLKITKRDRSTIEELYGSNIPVFHVFTLSALQGVLHGSLTEYDFNGRFAPYFPALSLDKIQENAAGAGDSTIKRIISTIRLRNRQFANVERILEEDVPGLMTPTLSGVTKLRLLWQENPTLRGRLDELFYRLDATDIRPFLRFLPIDGIPLTKLYSPPGSFSIPESIPIELIKQWAQEKSPISDADYLFVKVLLFSGGGQPLFGTLKMMEDGSADFVVLPPKNVRKLTPSVEFSYFTESLSKSLIGTGYESVNYSIQEASVISFFKVDGPRRSIKDLLVTIRRKLQSLSYFFQEIVPLPNEQPLISLRYKRVSNFANEDRIFSFLTQVITRKLIEGTETLAGLPKLLADEFGISEKEAEAKLVAWNTLREQFAVGETTKKNIKPAMNPGTDIYIYAQHPLYFCHIYRADSGENLDRIYTLLSMLLNVDEDELRVSGAIQKAEEVVVNPPTVVAAATAAAIDPSSPENILPEATEDDEGDGEMDFGMMYEIPNGDEEGDDIPENVEATQLPKSGAPTQEEIQEAQKSPPRDIQERQERQETPPHKDDKIIVSSFFLNRLKMMDGELIKTAKNVKGYSVGCTANEDRQPLIMDELQYKRMRDIYDEDEDLVFIEFPLREKTNPAIAKDKEVAYVLKYGSDPSHQNYFICSEYFCVRDDIWIRKKEFEKETKDRDGNPKPKNSCPFCHGTVIVSKDHPEPGQTVLKRKNKPKKEIPHLFINFLQKKTNQHGLSLPCCFINADTIRYEETPFNHIREYEKQFQYKKTIIDGEPTEENQESEETPTETLTTTTAQPNYDILRLHLNTEYIIGQEKYPLEPGKIGLPPPSLDKYLGQVSSSLVSRDAIRQELKKNASGFLRVGVQNSVLQRDKSLFAALAPLLGTTDTAQEVAQYIKKSINPVLFQSFNFGNLVLEFYDPTSSVKEPTEAEMDLWVKRHFPRIGKLGIGTLKYDYLLRLYNAYYNFEAFLDASAMTRNQHKKPYELRQFVHMLAEPGVLTERGITIIVLDYNGPPNSPDTEITVRCPLQGYAAANYTGNDIAFLTHDANGIWEPLIYTNNIPEVGGRVAKHEGHYVLQANPAMMQKLPDEILARIREFKEKCNSSGVAAYTSQMGVKPETLIPKYTLLYADEREQTPYGLVRDAYNHLVAATFVTTTKKIIAVPLADDGTLDNFPERRQAGGEKKTEVRKIHFGWEDITPLATTDEIIDFFVGEVLVKFSAYKGYAIQNIVTYPDGKVAVVLRNGIPIPAASPPGTKHRDVPVVKSNTFPEWTIDNGIVMDTSKDQVAETFIPKQRKQIEEVFQHLRFTFANFISKNRKILKQIRQIIDPRRQEIGMPPPIPLELFERRKRLEILLGPIIRGWLAPSDPFNPQETLLRMDCSQITDSGRCSNFCTWRRIGNDDEGEGEGEGEEEEEGGRNKGGICQIHSPTKVPVGSKKDVDAVRFFTLRLMEEILRIPEKRRQLFGREVSYLSSPKATTRMGDQLIIPEINSQWFQVLMEEKTTKGLERPRFFEEFSRIAPPIEGTNTQQDVEPLPESLVDLMGETEEDFALWMAPNLFTLVVPLNIRLLDFLGEEYEGQDFQALPEPLLKKMASTLKKTILQIDMTNPDTPVFSGGIGGLVLSDQIIIIVITESGEPAFLIDTRFPTRPIVDRSIIGKGLQNKLMELKQQQKVRLVRPKVAIKQ